ncbi:iron chaperone [Leptospira sp. WS92.C1]
MEEIRKTIREQVPEATEKISYQIPTFYLNGNLVHFAAYKKHIGFYPTPNGDEAFQKELSKYKSGKGTARFPMEEPFPIDLIQKMIRMRIEESLKKKIRIRFIDFC